MYTCLSEISWDAYREIYSSVSYGLSIKQCRPMYLLHRRSLWLSIGIKEGLLKLGKFVVDLSHCHGAFKGMDPYTLGTMDTTFQLIIGKDDLRLFKVNNLFIIQ